MGIYENLKCLHSMFDKKKFGEAYTPQELLMLKRLSNSKLLRSLVDPEVDFDMPEDYIPAKLELELSYFAVSGRPVPEGTSIKEIVRVVGIGLECAKELKLKLFPERKVGAL